MSLYPTSPPDANSETPLGQHNHKPKASPQKVPAQFLIATPREVPEGMGISNEASPGLGNLSMRFIEPSNSSPFVPFCRETLSPFCSLRENFITSNSKRVLFSPFCNIPNSIEHEAKQKISLPNSLNINLHIENTPWPKESVPLIKKCPIRRLNFDNEPHCTEQIPSKNDNVQVRINKIKNPGHYTLEKSNKKSSPIQLFNSFLSNAEHIPSTSKSNLIEDEGLFPRAMNKQACCNCKKSGCLKLYCECFSSRTYCFGCNCVNCLNIKENDDIREKAMRSTLERNPVAFEPKFARDKEFV
jgi:hypothetical protein